MKALDSIIANVDAAKAGISRQQLSIMVKRGELTRLSRGVYARGDANGLQHPEIAILFKRKTDCVIALESALRLHDFTTATPHSLWIAMRRGARKPVSDFPLEVVRLEEHAYETGIQELTVDGVKVRVYSPAKTVCDIFKFRNRIGLDVAIESLYEGFRKRMFTVDELFACAEVNRVKNVMRPYVEGFLR